MTDNIHWWNCQKCHGTGRIIIGNSAFECRKCDGTGNAFIDGEQRRLERRLNEIDAP